jgi:hypothetical protein
MPKIYKCHVVFILIHLAIQEYIILCLSHIAENLLDVFLFSVHFTLSLLLYLFISLAVGEIFMENGHEMGTNKLFFYSYFAVLHTHISFLFFLFFFFFAYYCEWECLLFWCALIIHSFRSKYLSVVLLAGNIYLGNMSHRPICIINSPNIEKVEVFFLFSLVYFLVNV